MMPQTAFSAVVTAPSTQPGRPGDVVAGQEDAALVRRQPVLHEVAVQAPVVAVVAGQGGLERAQEVAARSPRRR